MKFICLILLISIQIFAQDIQKLSKKHRLNPKMVGYQIIDANSGKVISEHNAKQTFTPGSVQKILTAVYALENLGPDFRPQTKLHYTGSISNNQLDGDLILIGGGDPYFHYQHLFKLALSLKQRGIKKITGKLLFDDSHLGKNTIIEQDGLIDEGYNSGVSALSVNFNQTKIWKSKKGFETIPGIDFINFSPQPQKYPDGLRFDGSTAKDEWYYSTFQRYKYQERIPIRNASQYTAEVFHYFLKLLQIEAKEPIEAKESYQSNQFAIHYGLKLDELLSLNMEYSNNLMAELILMNAVKKQTRKSSDIFMSAKIMNNWFKHKYSFENKKFRQVNASGLGDGNLITPHALNRILKDYYLQLWTLLPINGIKGYLKKRLNNADQAFRIWAKTGTLDYGSGIAGILTAESNKTYLFNIFINDPRNRAMIFSKNRKKAYRYRNSARNWDRQAQGLEDDLLKHWVTNL